MEQLAGFIGPMEIHHPTTSDNHKMGGDTTPGKYQ